MWWQDAVIYNAYPRSWQDSDGDGIGDLPGIIDRLDHLEWLGVDGLWLNPIFPSPNRDLGYDVSDYTQVHPDFGTLDDVDHLVVEAQKRGIRVLLDLVPSHTSDQHPWFEDARRSRTSRFRDYYVWRPRSSTTGVPNNWQSYFGGSAWTFDEATDEYYLHNFLPRQPQLNWWNRDVSAEFDRIFSFWFDRGVAGFRLDALQALLYDPAYRDNPPAAREDTAIERDLRQRFVFNANRPEAHDIIRGWRRLAQGYEHPRLLFGETWVPTLDTLSTYYGNGHDELHMAWNLPFLTSRFRAADLAHVVGRTIDALPSGAVPTWAISTHDDDGRAASRWCAGDDAAIRCALFVLLGLGGASILYYGDEIGMTAPTSDDVTLHPGAAIDPRLVNRTPMQWERETYGGFSSVEPWLAVGDAAHTNVADQMGDPNSVLRLCRELIRLRPRLAGRGTQLVPAPPGALVWRRGDATVAVNLASTACEVDASGSIHVSSRRDREGERVARRVRLEPLDAVVVL
jgi:alpha-glucosidase